MNKKFKLLVMAGAFIALAGVAQAAGFLTNGLPPAGGTQYPSTFPLTGNETIPADTNLPSGLNPASEAVTVGQLTQGQFNTITNSTSVSVLNTQVAGGSQITVLMTGAQSTSSNITLPSATSMIAAMPSGAITGYSYLLKFVNVAGLSTWTVVAGASDTISGNTSVAASGSRAYLVSLPTATTVLLKDIGNGF